MWSSQGFTISPPLSQSQISFNTAIATPKLPPFMNVDDHVFFTSARCECHSNLLSGINALWLWSRGEQRKLDLAKKNRKQKTNKNKITKRTTGQGRITKKTKKERKKKNEQNQKLQFPVFLLVCFFSVLRLPFVFVVAYFLCLLFLIFWCVFLFALFF